MRVTNIVRHLDANASAAVEGLDSPFHAGAEVVAEVVVSIGGTGGSRGWTVEGNNEPEGSTAVWTALTAETIDTHTELYTITMPRQIRLNTTTAGSGSKDASLHLLGGT